MKNSAGVDPGWKKWGGCWSSVARPTGLRCEGGPRRGPTEQRKGSGGAAPSGVQGQRPGGGLGGGAPGKFLAQLAVYTNSEHCEIR